MVLSNEFTCPNNHKFVANAKLRARCPECGQMARRPFGERKVVKTSDSEPGVKERLESTRTKPDKEPEEQETESDEPSPKKQVKVLRAGRTREQKVVVHHMAKPKLKSSLKIKSANGLIKHKKVIRRAIPSVNLKPRGNREHKIIPGGDRPYWHDVADKYGIQ